MTQPNPGSLGCVVASWGIAALAGALIAVLLMAIAGFSFAGAAFLGGVAFIILGLLFMTAFCRSLPAPGEVQIETPVVGPHDPKAEAMAEMAAKSSGGAAAASASASGSAAATAATATAAPAMKSTLLSGEAELASRKGEWKYDGAAPAGAAKEKAAAAAKPDSAAQATPAPAPAQQEAKAKPAKKPAAKKKADAAPAAAEEAPETLTGPRAGETADDLKLLKGVGPGLEKTLNELGFFHFDQIAKWGAGEIAWVDSRLKFKGRIERDDWVSQAQILASGGETEFSKRGKKG